MVAEGGTRLRIAVDEAPFIDAWSIDRVHWAKDGSEVHVLYNRRGHQQLSVLAIDAKTGTVRTVVEERSETFVDYSQKTMLNPSTSVRLCSECIVQLRNHVRNICIHLKYCNVKP